MRRPLRVPARLLTVAVVALLVAVTGLVSTPPLWRDRLMAVRTNGGLDQVMGLANAVDDLLFGVAVLSALAAAGGFVTWLYRARRNLEVLAAPAPAPDPAPDPAPAPAWGWGWALVGWLVPVANLVIPPLVVMEVAGRSLARVGRRGTVAAVLTWAWWACLVGLAVSLLAERPGGQSVTIMRLDGADAPAGLQVRAAYAQLYRSAPLPQTLLGVGLVAGAAVLAVALVRLVTVAQEQQPTPAGP